MKRIITRACGHQEKVAIYGPYHLRDERLRYEEGKLCYECWKKQKQQEKERQEKETQQ